MNTYARGDNDNTFTPSAILTTNKQYFANIFSTPDLQSSVLQQSPPFKEESTLHMCSFTEPNKETKETKETADPESNDESTDVLEDMILYEAYDAIEFDLINKIATMRGKNTTIGTGKTKLVGDHISFNWETYTVIATGHKNEDGTIDPKVVFTNEQTTYLAEEIRYNFKSHRGKARKLFTKQEDALIRTKTAKKDTPDTYYVDDMHFTTCNHAKPHYAIKAKKIKYVNGKRIASGPFHFEFHGVPTPLGFFYGLFYIPTPKSSGIIFPQMGENPDLGFYLRDGGYYIYLNDYIDLALRGSIYTKGTKEIKLNSNYISRYQCKGDMLYRRTTTPRSNSLDLAQDNETEWQFTWHHETLHDKMNNFIADVDIRNSFRTMYYNPNKLNGKTNSKIRYTRRRFFGTPYTMSASVAHNEDFSKEITNMTFPHIAFTSPNFYIGRLFSKSPTSNNHWYNDLYLNLYFKHTAEFQNELSNKIGPKEEDTIKFWQHKEQVWEEKRYGFKHTVPIETNIKIFNYFNLNPFLKYTERWYFKRRNYRTVTKFRHERSWYRVYDYNMGANLKTTIYGTYLWGEDARIQGIRHRIEPSLGFTYTPDFSKASYKYYQTFKTKDGEKKCNRFENAIFGTPPEKDSAILTADIDNVLELKTRDSSKTGNASKKIPIFESLNAGTGYDFLEKTFPLQDIKIGARTHLLDNLLSLEYETTIDPYHYHRKKRIPTYAWQQGNGLGTATMYKMTIGTSFKSKKSSAEEEKTQNNPLDNENTVESQSPSEDTTIADPAQYVDVDLPWEFKIAYQRTYTYQIIEDIQKTTNHIPISGKFNISKNWNIGFETDYDLDNKELVGEATQITIDRDLHCWQMTFKWSPIAKKQTYDFSIGIKAPMLQDIKYPHSAGFENI